MSFITLLYHEIREDIYSDQPKPSPIVVNQPYNDLLPPPLFVSLESFKSQMAWLFQANYHTLTLDEASAHILKGTKIPDKSVLITFDDCYQSVKQYAYPILKSYHFNATSFVVGGWLNDNAVAFSPDTSTCMSTTELCEMSDVFEFANHSYNLHTRTNRQTSAMMVQTDEMIIQDLQLCSHTKPVSHGHIFAYPFGLYNEHIIDLLRRTPIKMAFTTVPGINTFGTHPLELHRNVVPFTMGIEDFQGMF